MDTYLFGLLNKRVRLPGKVECKIIDVLFGFFALGVSIMMHYYFRGTKTWDYENFLKDWFAELQEGGMAALGNKIGDYTPAYLYFMALAAKLPFSDITSIKLITFVFDYLTAFSFFIFTYRRFGSVAKGTLAWSGALFLPSLLCNGALWGQCDIIFTSFLLLSFLSVNRKHPALSCVFAGVAFSFKLQAVFFIPVLLVYWFKSEIKLKHFLFIPLVYLISILPAVLLGRNFLELLTVYFHQMNAYTDRLTIDLPNVYMLIGNRFPQEYSSWGILYTFALLGSCLYYLYQKQFRTDTQTMLLITVFFMLLIPYFLPYMHERYAFPADIFALLLACANLKYSWIVIATQLLSLASYQSYLFHNDAFQVQTTALAYLVLLCLLARALYKRLQGTDNTASAIRLNCRQ